MKKRLMCFGIVLISFSLAPHANACPNCFGANDSSSISGMNAAIFTMLGITTLVMASVIAFVTAYRRRSRRLLLTGGLSPETSGTVTIPQEKGSPEWNNS